MKKALVAVFLLAPMIVYAACPQYAPYRCVPGANGKMICGCGV
jgi:hypothetical protein